jgi:hypothetical protein
MTLKEIRDHLHRGPFKPLTIRLTSGRSHRVQHPDFLLIPPVGESFLVVDPDGTFHHLDADQMEEIEIRTRPKPAR